MRFRWALVFALVFLAPALAFGAGPQGDSDAVRGVFTAYREAILAKQGGEAAALLSRSTFDYYEKMRKLALTGDAKTVQAESLSNQLQVLLMRLRVPTEKLESLSSQALIAYAIDEGWIGRDSVVKLKAGDVLTEGDIATLAVSIEGVGAGPGFRFNREPAGWRLDLVPLLQMSNLMLQMAAKEKGIPEDQFMLGMLESVVGRKIGPEAWVPPRAAKKS